ncbi:hypothetical protein P7K49_012330 [Saguinus oedipus]|uniref:Uncharacterized protein n=1 Tax=Saguinus oedipus TaxID=9490 RepID=A0ABQ9VVJ3_SAGOE|nr:hypothetical protein P7K49_012330 [Saguinus oedipus]
MLSPQNQVCTWATSRAATHTGTHNQQANECPGELFTLLPETRDVGKACQDHVPGYRVPRSPVGLGCTLPLPGQPLQMPGSAPMAGLFPANKEQEGQRECLPFPPHVLPHVLVPEITPEG